ncbi:MAG: putative colanic acid biosynthesis acetyltransferase [Phycisphaerales bacterium]
MTTTPNNAETPPAAPDPRGGGGRHAAYLAAEVSDDPTRRHISPYSAREKVARMLWAMVQGTAFAWSYPTWYGWRNFLLRRFGAGLHATVHIRRTARIECPWNLSMGANSSLGDFAIAYCLGPITIGGRASVSQYAHLCAGTHDYTKANMPLIRPPIVIGADAWIAADAFVGPGVTVGEGAILGARAVALKDLEPWTIYSGNPARAVKERPRPGASSGAAAP